MTGVEPSRPAKRQRRHLSTMDRLPVALWWLANRSYSCLSVVYAFESGFNALA